MRLKHINVVDIKSKPKILDHLGPHKRNLPKYDYTPLRVSRSEILQQVESLGILEKPAKMLSPSEKERKGNIT